jgi:UDP-N-acetylglucosamine 2-epimerase
MSPPEAPRAGNKRRIGVITTSRADYSHLYWPLRELSAHPDVDLAVFALGAHLSPEFGNTLQEIERDGFPIQARIECLLSSDTDTGMAKTIGIAILGLADALTAWRPDILLLIADRYEMLAPAAVALAMRIPIAHIEGGEVSQGAIDDQVRNALTKLAHIHFTSTPNRAPPRHRHGRGARRVHHAGAPSLDHLRRSTLLDRATLEAKLGLKLTPPNHPRRLAPRHHPQRYKRRSRRSLRRARTRLPANSSSSIPTPTPAATRSSNARELLQPREAAHTSSSTSTPSRIGACSARSTHGRQLLQRHHGSCLLRASRGQRRHAPARPRTRPQHHRCPRRNPGNPRRHPPRPQPEFRESLRGMTNPYGNGTAAKTIAHVLTTVPLEGLLIKQPTPIDQIKSWCPMSSEPDLHKKLGAPGLDSETWETSNLDQVTIPLSAPDITQAEIDAVGAVLRTPHLSLGPELPAFEAALAAYHSVPHAVAVSSGTAGLHLALLVLGIGEGDEVIIPSFAFIAVANAVLQVRATPVFAEIDPITLNLDPEAVERAITSRTRALLVVHTFGVPADMDALQSIARRRKLAILEDACEAIGAEFGSPGNSRRAGASEI